MSEAPAGLLRWGPPRRRAVRGFTLLEIMVVVLLIGITVTLVSLSLGRDADQIAELEARRFMALVEHVREESILTGRTLGIEVVEQERRLRFVAAGDPWTPIEGDDTLRERRLPEAIALRLELPAQATAGRTGERGAIIVVESMGEIAPFVLTVIGETDAFMVTLDAAQNLQLERRDARTS